MANYLSLMAVDNKSLLIILMVALIVFLVLLTVLGIVFIIALRKRAPVIKVVMAPPAVDDAEPEEEPEPVPEPAPVIAEQPVEEEKPEVEETPAEVVPEPAPAPAPAPVHEPAPVVAAEEDEDDDDDDGSVYVTEGQEKVRYDRSMTAKLIQLKDEPKEWYSQIKNELLSYQKVKDRMSWKKETFRLGRMTVARLVVRGKTLCLMLAVEPQGFVGTKYAIEDVSGVASNSDTPSQYRIKSGRRAKYAKELIGVFMRELGVRKDPAFEAQDYFLPYEGTMGLMERGLVKRIVTESTRVFEIREVEEAAATKAEPETEETPVENTVGTTVDNGTETVQETEAAVTEEAAKE